MRFVLYFSPPPHKSVELKSPEGQAWALLTPPEQIVTFDEGGVSGHINHRAVSAAVR